LFSSQREQRIQSIASVSTATFPAGEFFVKAFEQDSAAAQVPLDHITDAPIAGDRSLGQDARGDWPFIARRRFDSGGDWYRGFNEDQGLAGRTIKIGSANGKLVKMAD
jgi:hypothetical protein